MTLDRHELTNLRRSLDEGARKERENTVKIDALGARNLRLAELLKDSRDQLAALKGEVERLGTPPSTYGTVVVESDDPETVDVMAAGRQMRLTLAPGIDHASLVPGHTVRLNEAMTVVELCADMPVAGVTAVLRDVLADGRRARVVLGNDEEHIVHLASALRGNHTGDHPAPIRPGDAVLVDTKAGVAFEVVPKAEVDELLLEEVPTVDFSDIGGLVPQIEQIRDAIELPFIHYDLYREFHLAPPKGVLLYGPPGNGKTLIAKAVAHSLARASAQSRGEYGNSDRRYPNSYFLSIKGPELLNKYVGETERHIRSIFERARDKATEGNPVIVFFDEMDSIFRTRGSGVSSDMETTIVPQLLAEIDGVEDLRNVIIIGASNREDMIDPAILRPGRLDLKIRIDRPDRDGAADILAKYVTKDLRFDPAEVAGRATDEHVQLLIGRIVDRLYTRDESTTFVNLVFASGRRSSLHLADLTSGAMLRNIVDRAKKIAIKDIVRGDGGGLTTDDFLDAVDAEFSENSDLPNTTNPQEWARLSGVRGERVVEVIVPDREGGR